MDITKLKTRLRFRSAKKTTNQAALTDVVSDLEAISAELNTAVKVTSSAQGVGSAQVSDRAGVAVSYLVESFRVAGVASGSAVDCGAARV